MQRTKSLLGNKAVNLLTLQERGCNVPKFFTLTLGEAESNDLEQIIHNRLRNTFQEQPNLFVVRSSACMEDQANQSFAGHFHSEVAVLPENIPKAVQAVAQSLKRFGSEGSIIVQRCITSSVSGVLFTDAGDGSLLIEANAGLCTSVVAGNTVDRYVCNVQGSILESELAENKSGQFIERDAIVERVIENGELLSQQKVRKVCEVGMTIQNIFGSPQDIEWCFLDDELFILQSRPVTRKIIQEEMHYDSANIAESYTGIVLPLTFSFAQEIYKYVYQDLLVASGVSRSRVLQYVDIFENMLGHFFGRMYYNMNSWYRMMAFLPGYKRNKQNLEHMITSSVREEVSRDIEPTLWLKVKYPFLALWKMTHFKKTVWNFEEDMKNLFGAAHNTLEQNPSMEECESLYRELHEKMLRRWYITVENDFLVMTYFGILRKMISDEEELLPFLHFDNISVQQVRMLSGLAKAIFRDEERLRLYEQKHYEELRTRVEEDEKLNTLLQSYLARYGGRFANELKLESPDISENMHTLFSLLHHYATREQKNLHAAETTDTSNVKGLKRLVFSFVLKRFRSAAKKREDLRLLRSKAFSIIRRIFRSIGEQLAEQSTLRSGEDVFYLTVDEIFTIISNKESAIDWQKEIDQRKKQFDVFRNTNVHSHFSCKGNKPSTNDITLNTTDFPKGDQLRGRGCTPGIITGRVNILTDFQIPQSADVEIIVARHTDPGWTPLIGLAKGMIIEQGGLLSHASIVSRELGIPTVIGVQGALETLQEGQIVTLDGSEGTVVVHDENHHIHQRRSSEKEVSPIRAAAVR